MSEYYNVTVAEEGKDGKTYFTKVGVAWPQRDDAKSFMKIQLTALPVNGELILFAPKDSDDGD